MFRSARENLLLAIALAGVIGLIPALAWSILVEWGAARWPFDPAPGRAAELVRAIAEPPDFGVLSLGEWCHRAVSTVLFWGPSIGLTLYSIAHIPRRFLAPRKKTRGLHRRRAADAEDRAALRLLRLSVGATAGLLSAAGVFGLFLISRREEYGQLRTTFTPENWHYLVQAPLGYEWYDFHFYVVGCGRYFFPWFAWFVVNIGAATAYVLLRVGFASRRRTRRDAQNAPG